MGALYGELATAIRREVPVALATVIEGPQPGSKLVVIDDRERAPAARTHGSLGDPALDRVVIRDSLAELEAGRCGIRHYGRHGEARQTEVSVFIESFAPPPRMIIFGAVDFTASLVSAAKLLGFHVTVCDARAVFATKQRFPNADDVVVEWPQHFLGTAGESLSSRDAVCILTHDHKFDVPALLAALRTRVGYIGCMGSRRTHRQRMQRLIDEGVSSRQLERVMSPIGLDIGARTPAETAISICAEIIALSVGKAAPSLRDSTGPIHVGSGSIE